MESAAEMFSQFDDIHEKYHSKIYDNNNSNREMKNEYFIMFNRTIER